MDIDRTTGAIGGSSVILATDAILKRIRGPLETAITTELEKLVAGGGGVPPDPPDPPADDAVVIFWQDISGPLITDPRCAKSCRVKFDARNNGDEVARKLFEIVVAHYAAGGTPERSSITLQDWGWGKPGDHLPDDSRHPRRDDPIYSLMNSRYGPPAIHKQAIEAWTERSSLFLGAFRKLMDDARVECPRYWLFDYESRPTFEREDHMRAMIYEPIMKIWPDSIVANWLGGLNGTGPVSYDVEDAASVDACLAKFDWWMTNEARGLGRIPIPWLPMIGERFKGDGGHYVTASFDMIQRLYRGMKARGVTRAFCWQSKTPTLIDWVNMEVVIREFLGETG